MVFDVKGTNLSNTVNLFPDCRYFQQGSGHSKGNKTFVCNKSCFGQWAPSNDPMSLFGCDSCSKLKRSDVAIPSWLEIDYSIIAWFNTELNKEETLEAKFKFFNDKAHLGSIITDNAFRCPASNLLGSNCITTSLCCYQYASKELKSSIRIQHYDFSVPLLGKAIYSLTYVIGDYKLRLQRKFLPICW